MMKIINPSRKEGRKRNEGLKSFVFEFDQSFCGLLFPAAMIYFSFTFYIGKAEASSKRVQGQRRRKFIGTAKEEKGRGRDDQQIENMERSERVITL